MQKWEYLTVQLSSSHPIAPNAIPLPRMGLINGKDAIHNQPIHEVVSQLGRDGWEMTSAMSTEEVFGDYLFFKRAETSEPPASPEVS